MNRHGLKQTTLLWAALAAAAPVYGGGPDPRSAPEHQIAEGPDFGPTLADFLDSFGCNGYGECHIPAPQLIARFRAQQVELSAPRLALLKENKRRLLDAVAALRRVAMSVADGSRFRIFYLRAADAIEAQISRWPLPLIEADRLLVQDDSQAISMLQSAQTLVETWNERIRRAATPQEASRLAQRMNSEYAQVMESLWSIERQLEGVKKRQYGDRGEAPLNWPMILSRENEKALNLGDLMRVDASCSELSYLPTQTALTTRTYFQFGTGYADKEFPGLFSLFSDIRALRAMLDGTDSVAGPIAIVCREVDSKPEASYDRTTHVLTHQYTRQTKFRTGPGGGFLGFLGVPEFWTHVVYEHAGSANLLRKEFPEQP